MEISHVTTLVSPRFSNQSSLVLKNILKVALYSFFAARGIGTNGTSARVFKKILCFDDVTKKKGF